MLPNRSNIALMDRNLRAIDYDSNNQLLTHRHFNIFSKSG
jgi:hypothetical protein